jgi:hypothetical protein
VPDFFEAETGKSVFLGGASRFRRVERVSTMVESYIVSLFCKISVSST